MFVCVYAFNVRYVYDIRPKTKHSSNFPKIHCTNQIQLMKDADRNNYYIQNEHLYCKKLLFGSFSVPVCSALSTPTCSMCLLVLLEMEICQCVSTLTVHVSHWFGLSSKSSPLKIQSIHFDL